MQRAGGVAVPIFPNSGAERVLALAGLCGARTVVVAASGSKREEQARRAREAGLTVLDAGHQAGGREAPEGDFPEVSPGDLSYLQYTSGSTGDPKGVRITHAMAMANVEQLIADAASRGVLAGVPLGGWYPELADCLLVCVTEKRTRDQIDQLAEVLTTAGAKAEADELVAAGI